MNASVTAKTYNEALERFVHVWLPVARYHADGMFRSDADAKRFIDEAWAKFKEGAPAHEFGANWK